MSGGLNKTVKIGFFIRQTAGWMGGINYFKNLFIAISKVDNPKLVPYIFEPKDENARILLDYAQVLSTKKTLKYRLEKISAKLSGKKFAKEKFFERQANVDIISHALIPDKNSSIAWIPDFQHLHLPDMFTAEQIEERNREFKILAKENLLVIVSSQDALNDFKKFIPEYAHKARVLNFVAVTDENIYEKTDKIAQETVKKYNLPQRYFYVPNQFWKHKNHKVVYEAISLLKKEGLNIKVVFTGDINDYRDKEHFSNLEQFIKDADIRENVLFLGTVSLTEVFYLMRNCISIINPSRFEGWSSTVEEAKSLGKNIILSDINVHKEQNPPQGIYFNPNDSNELSQILKEKWQTGNFGPDYELENNAKATFQERIKNFGQDYQKIILEAIELKNKG